ncbi:MAG: hypothetical protein QNJ57_09235 [Flavobacteriaceae bacterium]|nr:hypothetical protein [Flavobacteriaceae bacterium]
MFSGISYAQQEASRWFFGENEGLDFISGNPIPDLNGALKTFERCTTISDTGGDLLFYTDGVMVWSNNYQIMPTSLLDNSTSVQLAIIVPEPGVSKVYHIFTADWSDGIIRLDHCTLDLTLERGLYNVLGANDVPMPTNLSPAPMSEKITALEGFGKILVKLDRNGPDWDSTNKGKSMPQSDYQFLAKLNIEGFEGAALV